MFMIVMEGIINIMYNHYSGYWEGFLSLKLHSNFTLNDINKVELENAKIERAFLYHMNVCKVCINR